jgi:hypothetical protein
MPKQTAAKAARSEIAQHGINQQRKPGPWKQMDSSRVARARYDSAARQVQVEFSNNGAPYVYEEVPPNLWKNFRRSASPGRYINRVLDNFPYYRNPVSFDEMDELRTEPGDELGEQFGEYPELPDF